MSIGDDAVARARADAEAVTDEAFTPAAIEALRAECASLFDALPEPPAYRRADDPAREQAAALGARATGLLARVIAASHRLPGDARLAALADAAELHVRALAAIANGELLAGEELAREAWRAARAASGSGLLVQPQDGAAPTPIFDRATGVSRYDPRPDSPLTVQLVCPNEGCRESATYALSPRHAVHRFGCQHCGRAFTGHFAELRRIEARSTGKATRYALRAAPLGGSETVLEFDDASGHELAAVPRDLLVLLYAATGTLAAVQNLTSGAVLWVLPRPACFVATAVYGEDAPQLELFRAFRDRALMPHRAGRVLVRGYYAIGPRLADTVRAHPRLRAAVRKTLDAIHGALVGSPRASTRR